MGWSSHNAKNKNKGLVSINHLASIPSSPLSEILGQTLCLCKSEFSSIHWILRSYAGLHQLRIQPKQFSPKVWIQIIACKLDQCHFHCFTLSKWRIIHYLTCKWRLFHKAELYILLFMLIGVRILPYNTVIFLACLGTGSHLPVTAENLRQNPDLGHKWMFYFILAHRRLFPRPKSLIPQNTKSLQLKLVGLRVSRDCAIG